MNLNSYINKIMIDSRFKNATSVSNTDFTTEISENLKMPPNTGAVITDVVIPRTFYNINETNNRLYFRINLTGGAYRDFIITLKPQNYNLITLAEEIINELNIESTAIYLAAEAEPNLGKIRITILNPTVTGFCVFTNIDLSSRCGGTWQGPYYALSNLRSMNAIISNDDRLSNQVYTEYLTGIVDLLGTHTVYIKSKALGNYSNLGPGAERDIAHKIINNVEFGDIIVSKTYLIADYLDVSDRYLKLIDFQITDAFGNVLNLNGSHISFSVLFFDTARYK